MELHSQCIFLQINSFSHTKNSNCWPPYSRSHDSVDNMFPSQQPSRHSDLGEPSEAAPTTAKAPPSEPPAEVKPLVIHFKATLHGLIIGASLLPSLKAQYKVLINSLQSGNILYIFSSNSINLVFHVYRWGRLIALASLDRKRDSPSAYQPIRWASARRYVHGFFHRFFPLPCP